MNIDQVCYTNIGACYLQYCKSFVWVLILIKKIEELKFLYFERILKIMLFSQVFWQLDA